MKKFLTKNLTKILSAFILFFMPFSQISINAKGNEQTCVVVLQKEDQKVFTPAQKGLRNILAHPFGIVFNAAFWGVCGLLIAVLPFVSSAVTIPLGLVCGAASKIIDLYEEGYKS